MRDFSADHLSVAVDFFAGELVSLFVKGKERLGGRKPLFRIRFRDQQGFSFIVTAYDAVHCRETEDGANLYGFL